MTTKYYTESELARRYDAKIKSPDFADVDAAVTRTGLKVAVGDVIRIECMEGLFYVDSITYEPWNKVEFWCADADENGRPIGWSVMKVRSEEICKVEKQSGSLVYFIVDGLGNIKIGSTSNLEKRLKAYQTHNPNKVRVVKTIPCANVQQAKEEEKRLHKRLSKFRLNGEWFELPEPVLNELVAEH